MSSIWKELMFLHGHFTRPEDLLDAAVDNAVAGTERREAAAAVARTQPLATGELACGGCA